jgi:hypothetical protein
VPKTRRNRLRTSFLVKIITDSVGSSHNVTYCQVEVTVSAILIRHNFKGYHHCSMLVIILIQSPSPCLLTPPSRLFSSRNPIKQACVGGRFRRRAWGRVWVAGCTQALLILIVKSRICICNRYRFFGRNITDRYQSECVCSLYSPNLIQLSSLNEKRDILPT